MCSHGSLLEGLGQGRMSVASAGNVLGRGAILEGKSTLSNHLTGVGANDVNTKKTISLRVGNHLDDTLSVEVGLGTGVGAEREGSDAVGDLLALQVLFGLANPGDLGVGVHDRGNAAVVDVTVALLDVLNNGNSLLLGLVGQHRAKGDITNAADVRNLGTVLRVNDDTATLIELHANVLKTQVTGVRAAANGNENNLSVQLQSC